MQAAENCARKLHNRWIYMMQLHAPHLTAAGRKLSKLLVSAAYATEFAPQEKYVPFPF